jgi:hypothetical protein
MSQEEFQAKKAAMSNEELISLVEKEISKLCSTGGKSFRMCVPVEITDTDMLLCEMLNRFKNLLGGDIKPNSKMENTGKTYGEAIAALEQGKMVQRAGWNGKGMFVFKQVPAVISKEIVPKMQSLPQAVKDEFERRFSNPAAQIDAIYYNNQMAIVNSSNGIDSWVASSSDTFAKDWIILD